MLERDLYQKTEPQTIRKADGSTVPSGEFITPMAYRQRKDDENHTDDTIVLYNNSLDSRSKVEQLKLQVSIHSCESCENETGLWSSSGLMFCGSAIRIIR